MEKLVFIFLLGSFLSGCDKDYLCKHERPDYFQVNDLNIYFARLNSAGETADSYQVVNNVDSAEWEGFVIVGQLSVSNYGRMGDECAALLGDLGAEELVEQIKVTDLTDAQNLTNELILTEFESTALLAYESDFSFYTTSLPYPLRYLPLDSLNTTDYRIMQRDFLLHFREGISKGAKAIEVAYQFENKLVRDTLEVVIE